MSSIDNDMKWIRRGLDLATFISSWSKDPSTKVGAVILDTRHRVLGLGYNGFPPHIPDTDELLNDREKKLSNMIHAEVNAINDAHGKEHNMSAAMLLSTHVPCDACALWIIDAGIKRVVALPPDPGMEGRWGQSYAITRRVFLDADVQMTLFMGDGT